MSAHKARRVVDQIRGRSYEEALILLEFMPYRACYPILKLISSAAANASHNKAYNKADLIISQVEVNKGTIKKKSKPRARGRSCPIKRSTFHIIVRLNIRKNMQNLYIQKRKMSEKFKDDGVIWDKK
ncbi:60S ribosomal protein L22 [Dionaea muscipula]